MQLLILERVDKMQLHELGHIVAVEVDGVVAEEDVIVQQLLIVDVFVDVLGHAFHLFDEQGVQSLGAERVDGDLRLRKRDEKQG